MPKPKPTKEQLELYKKLDDDSLDAIMEVVGSPKLYNDGKSTMRRWFLLRLRWAWNIPDPEASAEAPPADPAAPTPLEEWLDGHPKG